jgi:pilus assembly protein Flp/PilA
MRNFILKMWREEEGQDLIEYALIAALLALAAVTTMQGLATQINAVFTDVKDALTPIAG